MYMYFLISLIGVVTASAHLLNSEVHFDNVSIMEQTDKFISVAGNTSTTYQFHLTTNVDAILIPTLAFLEQRAQFPTLDGWDQLQDRVDSVQDELKRDSELIQWLRDLDDLHLPWVTMSDSDTSPVDGGSVLKQMHIKVQLHQPHADEIDVKRFEPVQLTDSLKIVYYYGERHREVLCRCLTAYQQLNVSTAAAVRDWVATPKNYASFKYSGELPADFISRGPVEAFLHPFLSEFSSDEVGDLNFSPMLRALDLIFRYGFNPSAYLEMISEVRSEFDFLGYLIERIESIKRELDIGIQYDTVFKNSADPITEWKYICDTLTGKEAFALYPDPLSNRCLQAMYTAIEESPVKDALIAWFRNDGTVYDEDGDSARVRSTRRVALNALSSHPAMRDLGHSGFSMSWSVAQFRDIYRKGWSYWVRNRLSSLGVGWDFITVTDAIELWHPRCLLYKLQRITEKMVSDKAAWPSVKFTPLNVWAKANEDRDKTNQQIIQIIQQSFRHTLSFDQAVDEWCVPCLEWFISESLEWPSKVHSVNDVWKRAWKTTEYYLSRIITDKFGNSVGFDTVAEAGDVDLVLERVSRNNGKWPSSTLPFESWMDRLSSSQKSYYAKKLKAIKSNL